MKEFEKKLNLPTYVPQRSTKASIRSEDPPPVAVPKQVNSADDIDFQVARQNIKSLLAKGEEALDGIMDLAATGEHPRAYEVAGQIIKTLVDANKDLMTIHKQKKDLKPQEEQKNADIKVNNAVFVGSTAELQQMVKEQRAAAEKKLLSDPNAKVFDKHLEHDEED